MHCALIGWEKAIHADFDEPEEPDLVLFRGGRRYGVELKHAAAPAMTKSMRIALRDLKLERAWVVYPGREAYRLHEKVRACPLPELLEEPATWSLPL